MKTHLMLVPLIPFLWSIGSIVAIFSSSNLFLAIFSGYLVLLLIICQKNLSGTSLSLKFSVPFFIPLIIVHGIINPAYHPDLIILKYIPIRLAGLEYASTIFLRIFILTLVVAAWKNIDANRLLSESISIGIPLQLIIIFAVTISTIRTVSKRANCVYLAQQSRGIPSGPGFLKRLKAFPAVVLPVITSTIIECDRRGNTLLNRGLGCSKIYQINKYSYTQKEVYLALSIIIPFLLLI